MFERIDKMKNITHLAVKIQFDVMNLYDIQTIIIHLCTKADNDFNWHDTM